jgi:hypothetical protein
VTAHSPVAVLKLASGPICVASKITSTCPSPCCPVISVATAALGTGWHVEHGMPVALATEGST